ncbi:hypothetical protein [Azonexus sp. R2A61]|uniref:hypothetical protein n=1 Tax=Azonexus sp. R2A61 TaxID=2744443 RepID=UPI001F389BEF|nr:hypothetical protein [Azonexus sp. R2A61]
MEQKESRVSASVFTAACVLLSASTAVMAAKPQQKVCYTGGWVVCDSDKRVNYYTEVGQIPLNPEWPYSSAEKVQSHDPDVPFAFYKIPDDVRESLAPAILAAIKKGTPDPYNKLTQGNVNTECYETRDGAEANRARRISNHLNYYRGNERRNYCSGNNGAEANEVAGAWERDPSMPKEMMVATTVQEKPKLTADGNKTAKKSAPQSTAAKHPNGDDRTPSVAVLSKQEERVPAMPTRTEPDAMYAPSKDYANFQSYASEAAARNLAQQYIDQGKVKPYGPVTCNKKESPTGAYGKYLYTCSVRDTPEAAPVKPAGSAKGLSVTK